MPLSRVLADSATAAVTTRPLIVPSGRVSLVVVGIDARAGASVAWPVDGVVFVLAGVLAHISIVT